MIDSKIDLNLLFTIVMRESKSTDIQEIDSDFYVYCTEYIGKLKTEEYDNIESKIKKNIIGIFTDLITILIELRFNKVINSNAFNLLLDEEKFVVETNYDFKNKQSLILSAILNGQNKLLENITNNFQTKLIIVRFLKPCKELIGFDLSKYGPFETEDIATIPNKNAQILIDKKIAEKIFVN